MGKEFRLLTADEIEVRTADKLVPDTIDGKEEMLVRLLLYKDARCDMALLDEMFGPMNWQCHYSRNNANCVISVWDAEKGIWLEKEDVGTADKGPNYEKALASDSFKRAAVKWGIGRELYTGPKILIREKYIKKWYINKDTKEKIRCMDQFKIQDIQYNDKREITFITILNLDNGVILKFNALGKYKVIDAGETAEKAEKQEAKPQPQVIRTKEKAEKTEENSVKQPEPADAEVEDELPFDIKK